MLVIVAIPVRPIEMAEMGRAYLRHHRDSIFLELWLGVSVGVWG